MNYNDMTDFEINKLVFKNSDLYFKCEDAMKNKLPIKEGIMWGDGANWHEFDPCNNPSDAWPIILENKINIAFAASSDESQASGGYYCCIDEKPLRAAMIVYLMMGEG
jgi:hypothetical protein